MKIGNSYYQEIIIAKTRNDQKVRADDEQEVIAIISDDNEIVVKNGYEVKMIPAPIND